MFTFSKGDVAFSSDLPESMALHLTRDVCVSLSGAPDGSRVNARIAGGIASLQIEHPDIIDMRRQLFFSESGAMTLHNQRVRLSEHARGTRFLGRSVAHQIRGIDALPSFSKLRVDRFSSVVVKRPRLEDAETAGGPDLGYWILPRLGFDTPFPADKKLLSTAFPHISPKSLTLLLMDIDARKWWIDIGFAYSFSLKFDLQAESRSREFLRRYTSSSSH